MRNFAKGTQMPARRIAVVFHRSLMLEGLVNLLEERAGLEVMSLDPSLVDVAVRLKHLSPEVIIVDGENVGEWPDLTLPQLLADNPEAKVIDVNLDSDEIKVYEQHRVTVGKFDDLLEAIGTPRLGSAKGGSAAKAETASEPTLR